MSSSAVICPACEIRAILSNISQSSRWQPHRAMATAMKQRRKPSRMTLSADVGRFTKDRLANKRDEDGPFAGMNVRQVPPSLRQKQAATTPPSNASKSKPAKEDRPLFHALKMQQTLTPMSYTQRDKIKAKLEAIESFEELGLTPPVANAIYTQALPGLEDYEPTPVQKLAIPALLSKKKEFEKKKAGDNKYDQFLVAAETGSGKTLAYLLPVIDAIKRQEELDRAEDSQREVDERAAREQRKRETVFDADPSETEERVNPSMGKPRALILLPSSELVTQVGKVAKVMSHTVRYRTAPISASNTATVIRSRLFNPAGIDIVVSTPHLIASIAEKEPNILSRLQYLIVDEADSLFDKSFQETTCSILDRAAPSLKQLILCSATIPRSLDRFMDQRFPEIKRLVTPKLHSITRRVQLGVVEIEKDPYRGNRSLACADAIWQIGRSQHDDTSKTHTMKCMMVFVNEREQAEEVATFLATKGIDAAALTRDTSESRQGEILEAFTSAVRVDGEVRPAETVRNFRDFVPFEQKQHTSSQAVAKQMRRLENVKVLVTTDLGSRGIDTLAVRHVILYDVPHTTIDFVHRLGRVGRMGRRGRAIILVGKHDRKDVVREVRDAMFKGQALI